MKTEKKPQAKSINTMNQTVAKAQKELTKLEAKKSSSKTKKTQKKEKVSFQNVPPVEVYLDSPEFSPVTENDVSWVVANVPFSIAGTRQVALSHRNSVLVDCGFSVKVPEGYKLVVELSSSFKDHGLEIYNSTIVGDNRVSFNVRNLGREIAVINHRDRVAILRIEPIYPLAFKFMVEDHDNVTFK